MNSEDVYGLVPLGGAKTELSKKSPLRICININ